MSLMAKLMQQWSDELDNTRDAIINNICGLISSYAPIWSSDNYLDGTIAQLGIKNATRMQNKISSETLIHEIKNLISRYEPRVSHVSVELYGEEYNVLNFRISAFIHSSIGDDKLILDSALDLSSNKLNVKGGSFV